MRYFKTSNASRQFKAGGFAFRFEPVENIGGSWLGLLAVEINTAASQLEAAKIPQVREITQEEYEGLKKKPSRPNPNLREPRPPQSNPQLPVVAPVARASTSSSNTEAPPPVVKPALSLTFRELDVPDELMLEAGDKRPPQ